MNFLFFLIYIKMVIAKNKNELEFLEKQRRKDKIDKFNGKFFHGIKDKKPNMKLTLFGIKQIKNNYCPECKSYNFTRTNIKNFCNNCYRWFTNDR